MRNVILPVIACISGSSFKKWMILPLAFQLRITLSLIMLLFFVGIVPAVHGENTLPPCAERPTKIDPPWVDGRFWCLEKVIQDDSVGELAFTSLAAAPDGTLYAARPLAGEVLALTDSDGDGLPDKPRVVAENLTLPNGLAYYDGALYISGGANIDRLAGDQLERLVDDLPTGTGFWTGGLTVGPDDRIYVSMGAPCDFCQPDSPQRGAILSFALDGSDQQVVATGLRQPSDVVFREGALWTVDTARDGLKEANLDELDQVVPGANFGWPYCVGADNHPDVLQGNFDCKQAAQPAFTFPTHSNPLGIAAYDSDTFPDIKGDLLVALGGSNDQPHLEGYSLVVVPFDATTGAPTSYRMIIPEQGPFRRQVALQTVHYQGSGFWPHRPLDVAVSAEGWIYISVGGGEILVLRPL